MPVAIWGVDAGSVPVVAKETGSPVDKPWAKAVVHVSVLALTVALGIGIQLPTTMLGLTDVYLARKAVRSAATTRYEPAAMIRSVLGSKVNGMPLSICHPFRFTADAPRL